MWGKNTLKVFLVSLVARSGWAVVAVTLLTLSSTAFAQTCPPATPSGPGTTYQIAAGTPWSTVISITNSLNPGDNLLFQRGGVFRPTTAWTFTRDGTAANKILIGAYGTGARPIINGELKPTSAPSSRSAILFDGANHVIVDGLEWTKHRNGIQATNDSNFITIRRNKIHDISLAGIQINDESDDPIIEYNEISNTGTGESLPAGEASPGESIYLSRDPSDVTGFTTVLRPIIRYNTVSNADSERIEFKAGVRNAIVEYNDIRGGNQGILVSHPAGDPTQHTNHIRYNLIRDITGSSSVYGMAIRSGSEIYNNVVVGVGGTGRPGIWIHDISGTGQTIVAHHNTVNGASGAAFQDGGGANTIFENNNLGWASGSGNFSSNPLFVNPAAFDFRLQSGSPANGFGAYAIGEALRPVGHTACEVTEPTPPAGTEIVADYNWDGILTDLSVAGNHCVSSGASFASPSPTQGASYVSFDANPDAITCPNTWHDPLQGTIRTLFNVSGCTHLAAGTPMYAYGETSSPTGFVDRKQIKVFNNGGLCQLTLGWGGNASVLPLFATVTPGTWYYIATTWVGGTLRAYLTPITGPLPTETGSAPYSALAAKGSTYTWGNNGSGTLNQGFRGGLKDSRVWLRPLSLPEIQADFTAVTGGSSTSATVTVTAWQVARSDSPQDPHHFLEPLNSPATVPSPGCADVRTRLTVTGGDITNLSLHPVWRQDGAGPYGPLGDTDLGALRLGVNLQKLNGAATTNQLSTSSFVPGSYMNANPTQALPSQNPPLQFVPLTLTDGQSTEVVTTVCPDDGLTAPTFFELCFAETSGALVSCPNPPRLNIGPALAIFKG